MSDSSTKPDLSDAYTKLGRARDHVADLEARIRAFLATDFYGMRLEADQREGRMKILFDSLHQPDKSINAVIGDAVSNLRSTLDYAAVALVQPMTGKTDGVGFPFGDDANGFAGEVRGPRSLGACNATVHDFFINEVQAYERGKGQSLWVLNKLRNIDKHRLLLATVNIAGVVASWRDANQNVFSDCGFGIVAGQSGTFIDAPIGHVQFTDNPRPTFEVLLNEPPYIQHQPIARFLKLLASDVEGFLNALKIIV